MKSILLIRAILSGLLTIAFVLLSSAHAQVPDADTIQAVAIYEAASTTTDTLPDSLVNYDVTDPALIDSMFSGIEADTMRDCSELETDNSAYVYVKFDSGDRKIYHLFFIWSHFSAKGDRGFCYYVKSYARDVFKLYAQQ